MKKSIFAVIISAFFLINSLPASATAALAVKPGIHWHCNMCVI